MKPDILTGKAVSEYNKGMKSSKEMAYLFWRKSETELVSFLLTGKEKIIGRDPAQCDIVLDDPRISRKHCSIFKVNSTYILQDLGSRNGTILEREKISRATLVDKSLIKLGKVVLEFRKGQPDGYSPAARARKATPSRKAVKKVKSDKSC
jgi:pSer/pThr/pTyr-binding forkhead associated (FHA) protein